MYKWASEHKRSCRIEIIRRVHDVCQMKQSVLLNTLRINSLWKKSVALHRTTHQLQTEISVLIAGSVALLTYPFAGADLGLGKGGLFFLCGQTTPISKPLPLIINTLY